MTPKEKATELTCKYFNLIFLDLDYDQAQQCALIAVDEILEITKHESPSAYVYYMQVKQEIEKL